MKSRMFFLILLTLLMHPLFASADGLIIVENPPPRPWIDRRLPPHHSFAPLAIVYHQVDVKIIDQVAVTSVDQVFHNPNPQRMEGVYLFPIPKGAQIDSFSMDINGKQVEAELLDADKARAIYEDIVRKLKDPALLEYAGQGAFKARIYPIEPRSDKRIKLKYTEVLKNDGGLIEYRYPLNTERFSAQPIRKVSVNTVIESKQSIKSVYCPTHEVEVIRTGDKKVKAVFETDNAKPDEDFKLYYSIQKDDRNIALNLLTFRDSSEDEGYFLLTASPGLKKENDEIVEKDIVFVLDASGSMLGDKLAQAKRALKYCIANLNDKDRFEIIRFSTEAEAFNNKLVYATEANREQASDHVDKFKARGGTAIEEALTKAAGLIGKSDKRDRPSYVVFLTDGHPTIGQINEKEILRSLSQSIGDQTIRVFSFGIGAEINVHLLDSIAEKTKAVSQYVLPDEDIEVKVSNFYERIDNPALTNINLYVSPNIAFSKTYPPNLPDLFTGDQLVVLGRYKGQGNAAVSLKGMFNGKIKTIVEEIDFPAPDKGTDFDFVPRLWAARRIGYLLDQIRLNGEDPELREEIVFLAKRFGIVTPYTSYLILEDEARPNLEGEARPRLSRIAPEEAPMVRSELGADYEEFKKEKSGFSGVGASKATNALKSADSASSAMHEVETAARLGKKDQFKEANYQLARFIKGRTFYWNGEEWIDSTAVEPADASVVSIKFGSEEYFDLIKKHPEATAWLSIGARVRLKINDKIYLIQH